MYYFKLSENNTQWRAFIWNVINIYVFLLAIEKVSQNYIIYVSVSGIQNRVNHSLLSIRTKEDTGWYLCGVFTLIITKQCSFERTVATVFRAVGNICCDTHTHTLPCVVFQLRCHWDFTEDKINSATFRVCGLKLFHFLKKREHFESYFLSLCYDFCF